MYMFNYASDLKYIGSSISAAASTPVMDDWSASQENFLTQRNIYIYILLMYICYSFQITHL